MKAGGDADPRVVESIVRDARPCGKKLHIDGEVVAVCQILVVDRPRSTPHDGPHRVEWWS